MKILSAVFFVLLTLGFNIKKAPQTKEVDSFYATSYVVLNRDDGKILEGKDIHLVRSVASISKIMTCILALESGKIFDVVTAPPEATKQVGSSIYLKDGEQLSLLDLCYGLMLRSGNDAAYTIAIYVGGDMESFVAAMNRKAEAIGMKHSTFTNPSGLDIDETGNLSTAYDMAVLISYALTNELFSKIVGTLNYSCQYTINWVNKNKLLRSYEPLDGGKTGYTYKAKRTLVTGATKDGLRLAVCTLNCGSDFAFHRFLYEKYFNTYAYVEFLHQGKNYIDQYLVESKKRYGVLLVKSQYPDGIKLYRFSPEGELLSMFYVTAAGDYLKVEGYE